METARVESRINTSKVDVCADKRGVLRRGHASSVRYRAENRSIAICSPVIGSGRTVGNSGVNYIDDALRDDSILKHRLIQIRNVIANNVTSEALLHVDWIGKAGKPAERTNVVRESNFTRISGCETNARLRRNVAPQSGTCRDLRSLH